MLTLFCGKACCHIDICMHITDGDIRNNKIVFMSRLLFAFLLIRDGVCAGPDAGWVSLQGPFP